MLKGSLLVFLIIIQSFFNDMSSLIFRDIIIDKYEQSVFPAILGSPLPMYKARKIFAADKSALRIAKDVIASYYTSISEGVYSNFEYEVNIIVMRILEDLSRKAKKNDVIVLNLATVLSDFELMKQYDFEPIPDVSFFYNFRISGKCTGVRSMVKCCAILKSRGFSLVFLSSRGGWKEGLKDATLNNLNEVGGKLGLVVTGDELFLAPDECNWNVHKKRTVSVGEWKVKCRQELVDKQCNIVACFGDCEDDFEGGNTGIEVRLPNYLRLFPDLGIKNYLRS